MADNKTQFKINKLAKDLGMKSKDLCDMLAKRGKEVAVQKALEPGEFDILFDTLTGEHQIRDIGDYLDGKSCIRTGQGSRKGSARSGGKDRACKDGSGSVHSCKSSPAGSSAGKSAGSSCSDADRKAGCTASGSGCGIGKTGAERGNRRHGASHNTDYRQHGHGRLPSAERSTGAASGTADPRSGLWRKPSRRRRTDRRTVLFSCTAKTESGSERRLSAPSADRFFRRTAGASRLRNR